MLVPVHHTPCLVEGQPESVVGDTWTTAVVPRLPATLAAQARALNACQRVRGVATPTDLLRAVLAYGLGALSTRRLGAWAVLIRLADMSATAWRQRRRACNACWLWRLGALSAVPGPLVGPAGRGSRPVRLIAATRLRPPGGPGDDWRVPCSFHCTAGRRAAVVVTDQPHAARLAHFTWRPGEIAVVDKGDGSRARGAPAVRQGADGGLRLPPATCPVDTVAGQACERAAWRCQGQAAPQEGQGWGGQDGQRSAIRGLAARLPPEAAARARQGKDPQAQTPGRPPLALPLARAAWVRVATTVAAAGSLRDVVRRYRARWQVERVGKRRTQRLRCNPLRRTHRTPGEATGRARLIAWAWQDGIVAASRALFPTAQQDTRLVVSTWSLVGLGLETLRHHVQPRWSLARLRACRPRLRRFLGSRPRRREPQATAVRAWLEGRSPQWSLLEEKAA